MYRLGSHEGCKAHSSSLVNGEWLRCTPNQVSRDDKKFCECTWPVLGIAKTLWPHRGPKIGPLRVYSAQFKLPDRRNRSQWCVRSCPVHAQCIVSVSRVEGCDSQMEPRVGGDGYWLRYIANIGCTGFGIEFAEISGSFEKQSGRKASS
jgi:hypothetical protein